LPHRATALTGAGAAVEVFIIRGVESDSGKEGRVVETHSATPPAVEHVLVPVAT